MYLKIRKKKNSILSSINREYNFNINAIDTRILIYKFDRTFKSFKIILLYR